MKWVNLKCYSDAMSSIAEVQHAAFELAPDERRALVESLLASLDAEDASFDPSPEWEAEIIRRIEDVDAGRASTTPGELVLRRAWAIVNAAKAAQV